MVSAILSLPLCKIILALAHCRRLILAALLPFRHPAAYNLQSAETGGINIDANAEKLLFALYAEWSGKKPLLGPAAQSMGLTGEALGRAVNALYTAGLVGGVTVKFGDEDQAPVALSVDDIILTRRGAAHIEAALGIKDTNSSIQKLQKIIAKASTPGWEGVKDIAAKALKDHMEAG